MPAPDPNRDPFEKGWERIATAWAELEALFQSDPQAIPATLKRVNLAFNTPYYKVPSHWLAAKSLDQATFDHLADRAASNLEKLIKETDHVERMGSDQAAWFRQRRADLARLLTSHFAVKLTVSPKELHRLTRAREAYIQAFR